jgi:leucyl aminopeptidase
MKPIMDLKLNVREEDGLNIKTDMLAVSLYTDMKLHPLLKRIDKALDGAVQDLIRSKDFEGKEGTSVLIYTNGKIGPKRLMLIGLGERGKITLDSLRKASISVGNKAITLALKNVGLAIHKGMGRTLTHESIGRVCAEGVHFGSYRYNEYVTVETNKPPKRLTLVLFETDKKALQALKKGYHQGSVIGAASNLGRTIANRPGNVICPGTLASTAKQVARDTQGLTCQVFNERQLLDMGMGGILAVGSGSKHPPWLIVLRHVSKSSRARQRPTVALVGKAVTFDSGGISIKPALNMDQMKLDKSGGVAILAVMKAVATLGLDINIMGLIPAAENLPGGGSYRPGDIVTTYSRKTVEVLNTDAEGRMILCDAIAYAVEKKCDIIIDIATLTGACMVALGKHMAGLFGSDETLIKQLQKAAEDSGEKVWHLPSGDAYAEEMKSKIADLKNTGSRWGGACTAAAFLHEFTGETKWAHLDIAGMDVYQSPDKKVQGSSGFGIRLLITYLLNLANET